MECRQSRSRRGDSRSKKEGAGQSAEEVMD